MLKVEHSIVEAEPYVLMGIWRTRQFEDRRKDTVCSYSGNCVCPHKTPETHPYDSFKTTDGCNESLVAFPLSQHHDARPSTFGPRAFVENTIAYSFNTP